MRYLILLLFIVGCALNQQMPKVEPTKPVDVPSDVVSIPVEVPSDVTPVPVPDTALNLAWNNVEWSMALVSAIHEYGMLGIQPRDWNDYINVWPVTEAGQVEFWAKILVVVAKNESSWRPATQYKENFKSSSTGTYVVSRGLFQISKSSSSQARYGCKWSSENELHDPVKNIHCATRIFSYWVKTDGVIRAYVSGGWRGPARYWSVIRGVSSNHTKRAWAAIKAANK